MKLKYIKSLILTDTFKQSTITFTGTIINGVLGILFFVFAARFLGPASFGMLTISVAAITLISDIADLGVDTGLVRFVGKFADSKPDKARSYMNLALRTKLLVGGVICFLGVAISHFWAETVFAKPELTNPLRLSFLGILGSLLFSFTTHSLQAFQRFYSWSTILVTTNGIRLIFLFGLFALGFLSMQATLITYIAMPFFGFVLGLFILPHFFSAKIDKRSRKGFFHYNKWVAAMTAVAAGTAKLDVFISARLLSVDQVGIYSAANQLAQVVPQIVTALGTVIAPKMASMTNKEKLIKYFRKTQLLVLGLTAVGLLGIPVSIFFIPLLYGNSYLSAIPIFSVLLVSMLIFLTAVPVHNAILYYFSYPKLFFYISVGQFIIVSIFGWFLIGSFGAMGAALAVLLGSIFNFVVPAGWLFIKLRSIE